MERNIFPVYMDDIFISSENLENDENDNNIDYEDFRESSDSEFLSEF